MTSVQELKDIGEAMGLKGSELRDFIKEQQDREREERQKQREYETEQHEKQREHEKQHEKQQSEEKQRDRDYELSRLKLELRRTTLTQGSPAGSVDLDVGNVSDNEHESQHTPQQTIKKGPKIPPVSYTHLTLPTNREV